MNLSGARILTWDQRQIKRLRSIPSARVDLLGFKTLHLELDGTTREWDLWDPQETQVPWAGLLPVQEVEVTLDPQHHRLLQEAQAEFRNARRCLTGIAWAELLTKPKAIPIANVALLALVDLYAYSERAQLPSRSAAWLSQMVPVVPSGLWTGGRVSISDLRLAVLAAHQRLGTMCDVKLACARAAELAPLYRSAQVWAGTSKVGQDWATRVGALETPRNNGKHVIQLIRDDPAWLHHTMQRSIVGTLMLGTQRHRAQRIYIQSSDSHLLEAATEVPIDAYLEHTGLWLPYKQTRLVPLMEATSWP